MYIIRSVKIGIFIVNSTFSKKNHKKVHFFYEKICRIKKRPYICTVKRKQPDDNTNWSIHLRARIPASHAGHRGSNPLSTTKNQREDVERHLFVFYTGRLCSDILISTTSTIRSPMSA